MSVNWKDLRAELIGPEDEDAVDTHRGRMLAEVRAHRLAEARKKREMTQKSVADAMGITQARVSAIERGALRRAELSTLEAYVSALGGKLEIVADFGDERIILG
ncbi:helix-turn-helix domain-containing protein [Kitasatospora acidiphila]|uniref:Helix-turn-helix domain-containing protein n=1 Tax=Kitasatospora acidiphila TaxID=2567942 RepID=A0A540W3H8_9ACTN|nr:helix-turn-helix domain-containing protein [Kitasatospora acidiphila]TQF03497.1 helix-turn-helix domain-containing protein [Kitasatospora acidiphila]